MPIQIHGQRAYKGFLSNEVFPFEDDRDGSSRRRAAQAADRSDDAVRAANNQRARAMGYNRPLTEREHSSGKFAIDTRTDREKVYADASVRTPREVSGNPYTTRIAELQNELATATGKRIQQIEARLRPLQSDSDVWDKRAADKAARDALMSSTDVQTALTYAQTWVDRLLLKPDVPQQWVEGARDRLESLKATGDFETFYRLNDVFEAERAKVLSERAAALDNQAAELKAAAADVRQEKVAPTVGGPSDLFSV